MAFRGGRDDRDVYYSTGGRSDGDGYDRRSPPRRAAVRERDDPDLRLDRDRDARVPAFMRDPPPRRAEAGPLVLRQRDVETYERAGRGRPRSPSPGPGAVRVHERVVRRERERSVSPSLVDSDDHFEIRDRVIERERERQRIRSPSRGPPVERVVRARFVDQERRRSLSPGSVDRTRTRSVERDHVRIVERERERRVSRSPSPPPVIRGPTIERDVITHYTDVDHGMEPPLLPFSSSAPKPCVLMCHRHGRSSRAIPPSPAAATGQGA